MTGQVTTKSGKRNSHSVVSKVRAYLTVKRGHEEAIREACRRFGKILCNSDPKDIQRICLWYARLVVFGDGRQVMLDSCFETDWKPYKIKKTQRLENASQQVLDDSNTQDFLQHSDLKPLLEQWPTSY